MGKKSKRVELGTGADALSNNPFENLDSGNLPQASEPVRPKAAVSKQDKSLAKKSRGRVDVSRQKAGRGGKTVTVATGFKGIAVEEKAALAKTIQKRCGVGGAVKQGNIEIQGDKRDEMKELLEAARFKVVFVGG